MTLQFQGVLWDMDGTLVDSEPLHERTLVHTLAQEGIVPPADLHERLLGQSTARIHEIFRTEFGLRASYRDWCTERQRLYLEQVATLQPRAGAMELFAWIQAQGLQQAVVSNADRIIVQANLYAVGLDAPDFISVSRNDVRVGKPDPEGYLRAAWLLGLAPAQALVIEDSPAGAQAGVAAGMTTAYWPQSAPVGHTSPAPATPALTVKDTQQIQHLLRGAAAAIANV